MEINKGADQNRGLRHESLSGLWRQDACSGMVIMACVHMFGNEESYFPLGSMIAAIAVLCLIIFGNIFSLCMGFDMAVSMGKTRKQYYPSAIIVYFLMTLVLLAGLFLLLRVETAIYGVLLPGKIKENIPIMTKFTVPWIFGGAAALNGCVALGSGHCTTVQKRKGCHSGLLAARPLDTARCCRGQGQ